MPILVLQDNDIPIERIDPPFGNRTVAEVKGIVSQRLMPITVNGDRQYYISARHGYVLQKEVGAIILCADHMSSCCN